MESGQRLTVRDGGHKSQVRSETMVSEADRDRYGRSGRKGTKRNDRRRVVAVKVTGSVRKGAVARGHCQLDGSVSDGKEAA